MKLETNNERNILLLVDDDSISNYVHEIIIRENTSFSGKIRTCVNGKEAIDFLSELISNIEKEDNFPNYILLDINMPRMDGFEFMDEFEKLSDNLKERVKICMLTSSLNETDKIRASSYKSIEHYLIKPLNPIEFEKILNSHE